MKRNTEAGVACPAGSFVCTVFLAAALCFFVGESLIAQQADGGIILPDTWKWHSGDDTAWACPSYDDTSWESVPFNTVPSDRWESIGWFRFSLVVDSAMFGQIAGLSLSVVGAAEIYFDGMLFPHSYGKVGQDAGEEQGLFLEWEPLPQPVPVGRVRRSENGRRLVRVALRYSSFLLDVPIRTGFEPRPALVFSVGYYNELLQQRAQRRVKAISHQMFFVGVFLAFALMHFLMFVFFRRLRINLYFSILMLAVCVLVWLRFDMYFQTSAAGLDWRLYVFDVLGNLAFLIALRVVYDILYPELPRRYRYYVILALLFSLFSLQTVLTPLLLIFSFEILVLVETAGTLLRHLRSRSAPALQGGGIIVLGFIPFLVSTVWSVLIMFNLFEPAFDFVDFPRTYYAAFLLFLSVSVFLSRRFAHTNTELEKQLVEVQRLGEENLKQEREKVLLEAENDRKQKELEEARDIQLSMLPDALPEVPGYDIAVYMKPATEVGGDYYDFHCQGPDGLTMACGDATGHGLQAGIMVAASKGLFMTLACGDTLTEMLRRTSLTLKEMGFERMFMALALARLEGNTLTATSAGMPFPLVYRAADSSVEEMQLRGMPLGSFPDFPYQELRVELEPGDVVLFMSDGLPEMFNPRDELYGDDRTKDIFARKAGGSAEDLVQALVKAGERWAEGRSQEDDVTFLVLKRKDAGG